jgi:transcriptional regulator with XRE-family HTH domain
MMARRNCMSARNQNLSTENSSSGAAAKGLPVLYPDFGARVREALTLTGHTVRDIERALQVKYEMARRYALGAAKPRDAKMRLLSKLFGCSDAWLSFGEGTAPAVGSVQLTPEQAEWLRLMAGLSEKQRGHVQSIMEDLVRVNGKTAPARRSNA